MTLERYGFDSRFAWDFDQATHTTTQKHTQTTGPHTTQQPVHPARVIRADRGRVLVHDGTAATSLPLTGVFIHDSPVVGDFIGVESATGRVAFVLERRQLLARRRAGTDTGVQPLAANVDLVWLAAPADRFNLSWIERGVRLVRDSGATPVIVVTKADLLGGRDVQRELFERHLFEDTVLTRADQPESYAAMTQGLAPGQTAALLGPSGAGKSTLLNALLGGEVLATGAVREGDAKGRHTTVRRELHRLPCGGLVIDTPGTRELGLLGGDGEGSGFDDIDALADGCRFADCRHVDEPGCAVQAAVETGDLPGARLASFHRQQRELAHLEEKAAETSHGRRTRERGFAKMVKNAQRIKGFKAR